jgi:hypothetical protein
MARIEKACQNGQALPNVLSDENPELTRLEFQAQYALYDGRAKTPLVRIVPDDRWPNMWRMVWPDGQVADSANLSRIKDAAFVICQRTAPGKDRLRLHWKARRNDRLASPVRQTAEGLSPTQPARATL